jgi:DNA-binding CsgD family transcriptional regulator
MTTHIPYHNPYASTIPDVELGLIRRPEIDSKLDDCLVNSVYPALASIVIERGMGGPATVRRYLADRANKLPYRVVQCDVKSDLDHGPDAMEFYRKLVAFVLKSREVSPVPISAISVAERIRRNTDPYFSNDLREDFFEFFRLMREAEPDRPLLLVFYNFDRLPQQFPLSGGDWAWLRELHDDETHRLYYVVVSRRSLGYVERLHGLQDSLFAARFSGNVRRVGLLPTAEAERIVEKGSPWPGWLRAKLLEWGGNHPYCLQRICFEMHNRLFNRHDQLDARAAETLALEWLRPDYLGEYFDRLYRNLERDRLLEPLTRAMNQGYHTPHHDELSELVEMGYFAPHPAYPHLNKMTYDQLFSPLFQRFLMQRTMSSTTAPGQMPSNWPPPGLEVDKPLSRREREVLWLMVQGHRSNKKLAEKLSIEESTVGSHVKSIIDKLDVHDRDEAVVKVNDLFPKDSA